MQRSKRVLVSMIVLALSIAMVPLWGRSNVVPCLFMWHYAISYGPPGAHQIVPEDSFPHSRPLCLDLLRQQGYNI